MAKRDPLRRVPSTIARPLLRWFRANARDLPWRRTRDPYRIWVSEVMLQQTQVDTVVPYYERFLARFPTVEALAAAPESAVMKHWEGLGYYSRARNLHRAARELTRVERFPETVAELRKLPGFGPYTAAAVASIAFGERALAVDGNVARVGSRLFCETDADAVRARLERELPRNREDMRAFTEGLMELGARVCRPRAPECGACPLSGACAARAQGRVAEFPVKRKRPAQREVPVAFARVASGGRLLLERRARGLLSGLWGLPWVEADTPAAARAALRAHVAKLTGGRVAGMRWRAIGDWAFTHKRWRIVVYDVRVEPDAAGRPLGGDWVAWDEVPKLALAGAHKRMLAQARERREAALRLDA